jgi:hypothetical protein
LIALTTSTAGCRDVISQSDAITGLSQLGSDGTITACVLHTVEYRNGTADCCSTDRSIERITLDVAGRPGEPFDGSGCPAAVIAIATTPSIALPDGGSLAITWPAHGYHVDLEGFAADGSSRWTRGLDFAGPVVASDLSGSSMFFAGATEVQKVEWSDGALPWRTTVASP